jgi:hypothetical protein
MRYLMLLALLVAVGCTMGGRDGKPAVRGGNRPALDIPRDGPQSPVLVRWKVNSDQGGVLQIDAVLTLQSALPLSVSVHVEMPPELELVSGQTSFEIPANTDPGEMVASFTFRYASTPSLNLKVVADASGPTMGVHATDEYRFGRAAPQQLRPNATGPNVKIGDRDLGPSIGIGTH